MPLPALDADGGLWLTKIARAEVIRYGADGQERWNRTIRLPDHELIFDYFFTMNREDTEPNTFVPLAFFNDAAVVGEELWLLAGMPEEEPAVIAVVSEEGEVGRLLRIPAAAGARSLAVTRDAKGIYLGIPTTAQVLFADVSVAAQ